MQAALDAERANPGTPADFIWIARNANSDYYTAQDIQVHDQNVFLYGGVDSCIDSSISGTTILSGSGSAAKAVMTISGNSQVWLSALHHPRRATPAVAASAAASTSSAPASSPSAVRASATTRPAMAPASTSMAPAASSIAELWINYDTIISNNTAATSGGGLRVEGNSLLRVVDDQAWIANNHADGGYGGGILVISPAPGDAFCRRLHPFDPAELWRCRSMAAWR